ncbi:2-phospho-L-lactate transferase [Bosea sp. BK604]|uniref:2-phospho-L-lactate transferase n=1 Tax=Bosea sp. BK604 TaxID=2512180 RepID=UPI001046CE9D|nr:2-phospho-L-lactate transferase [Bosea sp. BK604]TCR65637.1 LPPG:FO 2-phospho-L-lactate transferase [Bosea sp. BK604]
MTGKVVALSGGVGGAKLALGLARLVAPEDLLIVANTGDDFEHLGLSISPDIDTLTYVLSGLDDTGRGWGRRDESWNFMASLKEVGGETWFLLGDRDLALHVERTRRLRQGESLAAVTDAITRQLGIGPAVIPMSDDPVRTKLRTDQGWLDFQHYFVRLHCEPRVEEIVFEGAADAAPHPALMEALAEPNLRAIVICPSNPLISIEPILAVPGIRAAIARAAAPVVAVSPIVAGQALKGPTAKMLAELGTKPSAEAVFQRYADLLDAYLVEDGEELSSAESRARALPAATIMRSLDDRVALARRVLDAADSGTARDFASLRRARPA